MWSEVGEGGERWQVSWLLESVWHLLSVLHLGKVRWMGGSLGVGLPLFYALI